MTSFLELVADKIIGLGKATAETAVILPNKRSVIFLKNLLKQKTNQTLWLPEFFSLDSFLQEASGFSKADPLQLSLDLFAIHRQIAGNDQRSIDEFLAWAPLMISDFNDINLHLADADRLFTHLSANKAMQEWNPDGRPLTPMQERYLKFYQSLAEYYKLLHEQLVINKLGYPGLIYRQLAENFNQMAPQWPWKKFLVAGVNALSPAETQIFNQLNKNFQVQFLWDVDTYFFENEQHKAINPEPGRFIRQLIDQLHLPMPNPIENRFLTDSKTIDLVGVQGEIAQTKYVAQWLNEEANIRNKSAEQLQKTAIVLADEKLLIPLLDALPPHLEDLEDKMNYNITMGYPLKNSPYHLIIHQWATLLIFKEQSNGTILTRHLVDFLHNPLILSLFNKLDVHFVETLTQSLIQDNVISMNESELNQRLAEANPICISLLHDLLKKITGGIALIEGYIKLLEKTEVGSEDQPNLNPLQLTQRGRALEVATKLHRILQRNNETLGLKAAEKMLQQFVGQAQVNLVGEPLKGIQVMGLLETRTLDFDRILMLSCNEGILPAGDQMETFIPFDIRHRFGLPLPKDSMDVTAYHFYRLLQRARQVTYVYNTSTAGLGSNDESRFLLQLENELARANPEIKITRKQLSPLLETNQLQKSIEIAKTEPVMQKLLAKAKSGFSPSALNTYIICPFRFYLRYALGVSSEDSLEESMESNTFGSIVHGALENIYLPLEGKVIDPNFLRKKLSFAPQYLENEYRKIFKGQAPIHGKNLLMMEVSANMLNQTIQNDCRALEADPRVLIGVEKEVSATIDTSYGPVLLKGTIDRIDRTVEGNQVRVVDYKTGKVEPKNLKIDELSSLITNPDLSKAFQLMQYALMYRESNPQHQDIEAGNISLRNHSRGFISPVFDDKSSTYNNLPGFKKLVVELLEEILNKDLKFVQTTDKEACAYCDYKQICNKI